MKNHRIIVLIVLVIMQIPVIECAVKFNVARECNIADTDYGVAEIGSALSRKHSRIKDAYFPSIGGYEPGSIEQLS